MKLSGGVIYCLWLVLSPATPLILPVWHHFTQGINADKPLAIERHRPETETILTEEYVFHGIAGFGANCFFAKPKMFKLS